MGMYRVSYQIGCMYYSQSGIEAKCPVEAKEIVYNNVCNNLRALGNEKAIKDIEIQEVEVDSGERISAGYYD